MADVLAVARYYQKIRDRAERQNHAVHTVMPIEHLDPSLTNQFVYHNRSDWVISAAICGWFDCDVGIEKGGKGFFSLNEAYSMTGSNQQKGINLYE